MPSFLLRPRWIAFHVLVLVAIVGMLTASRWQWDKYNARSEFVSSVEERQDLDRTPPQPLVDLLLSDSSPGSSADVPPDGIEYRVATARGSYLPTAQLLQINRTQDGVNGVNVLTPFQIEGGPVLIVNRGFVPDGTEPLPPPSTPLVVGGTVRLSQQRRTGELTDNDSGVALEVRRVDLDVIRDRIGIDVAPVYLDLIASDPASPQPPNPVPPPDVTAGPPHLSYAIQWLIFAICAAVGWVFALKRSLRVRRRPPPSPDVINPHDDGPVGEATTAVSTNER